MYDDAKLTYYDVLYFKKRYQFICHLCLPSPSVHVPEDSRGPPHVTSMDCWHLNIPRPYNGNRLHNFRLADIVFPLRPFRIHRPNSRTIIIDFFKSELVTIETLIKEVIYKHIHHNSMNASHSIWSIQN